MVRVSMGLGSLAIAEPRREDRDEIHYRATAFGPDARQVSLLIVNISPHGLMARCDLDYDVGQRLRVNLPIVGVAIAEVRWSLGGRVGCQFGRMIEVAPYLEMLGELVKGAR